VTKGQYCQVAATSARTLTPHRREGRMDTKDIFPFTFNGDACKTCGGRCCRGSAGYVWVSLEELEQIAATKQMAVARFARQYVRRVQGKLSLQERVINGESFCCFFDPIEGQCTIYESRPSQCRTFPFWSKFETETQRLFLECPGVSEKIVDE
jgi:Fe-S-cluster containining protein